MAEVLAFGHRQTRETEVMSRSATAWRLAAGILLVSVMLLPSNGRADCPAVPSVPGMVDHNPADVQALVQERYYGNWALYLDILGRMRSKVEQAADSAVAETAEALDGKIAAVRCLADAALDQTRRLADFETASGGIATLEKLTVKSGCSGDSTRFVLVNRGLVWPAAAKVRVLRTLDGAVLADRELRLRDGQSVALNIRHAPGRADRLDLAVTADWDPSVSRYATERCGS